MKHLFYGSVFVLLSFITIGLSPTIIDTANDYIARHRAESIISETFRPANNKDVVGIIMDGGRGACSGVRIDPQTVLTANHCVSSWGIEFSKLEVLEEVKTDAGLSYVGQYHVLYRVPGLDFAIISSLPLSSVTKQIRDKVFNTVLSHLRAAVPGEKVTAVGFRFGGTKVASSGIVDSGLPRFVGAFGFFTTDISAWLDSGMSGGPIYGEDGKIVGLTSIGYSSQLKVRASGDGLGSAYLKWLTRLPSGMVPFNLVIKVLEYKLGEA